MLRSVPSKWFFDGNDDAGSVACNLMDHPGADDFLEMPKGLFGCLDLNTVYPQIDDLNPGEGCWPVMEKVVVIYSIRSNNLSKSVSVLLPIEVGVDRDFKDLAGIHGGCSLLLWWD